MKKQITLLFITLLFMFLSLVSLYLIRLGTAEPGSGAGNGNPVLIIVFLAIPIFISSFIFIYKVLKHASLTINRKSKLILSGLSFGGVLVLIFRHALFIRERVAFLGGGPDIAESWIYRFGWFNQYTNTFYFHANVYLAIVLLIVGIALLSTLKHRNSSDIKG